MSTVVHLEVGPMAVACNRWPVGAETSRVEDVTCKNCLAAIASGRAKAIGLYYQFVTWCEQNRPDLALTLIRDANAQNVVIDVLMQQLAPKPTPAPEPEPEPERTRNDSDDPLAYLIPAAETALDVQIQPGPIGAGANGQVYETTDGRIVKITGNHEEIDGLREMVVPFENILPNIDAIADLPDGYAAILREEVLPLTIEEQKHFRAQINGTDDDVEGGALYPRTEAKVTGLYVAEDSPYYGKAWARPLRRGFTDRLDPIRWADATGNAVRAFSADPKLRLKWHTEHVRWWELAVAHMPKELPYRNSWRQSIPKWLKETGGALVDVGLTNIGRTGDGRFVLFDLGYIKPGAGDALTGEFTNPWAGTEYTVQKATYSKGYAVRGEDISTHIGRTGRYSRRERADILSEAQIRKLHLQVREGWERGEPPVHGWFIGRAGSDSSAVIYGPEGTWVGLNSETRLVWPVSKRQEFLHKLAELRAKNPGVKFYAGDHNPRYYSEAVIL